MLRAWPASRLLNAGAALLTGGMAVTLAGLQGNSVALAGAGTVVAGIGFGASFLGSFGTLARQAAPAERGELFAVAYVIAYLAFSLPAVIAGIASTSVGLRTTAMAYGVAVGALSLTALAVQRGRAAHQRRPAPAAQSQPPQPQQAQAQQAQAQQAQAQQAQAQQAQAQQAQAQQAQAQQAQAQAQQAQAQQATRSQQARQSEQPPEAWPSARSQQRQAAGQRVDTGVLRGADGTARGRARH